MTFAYHPQWPAGDSSTRVAVSFFGEYTAGSDALTNSFLNDFYQGKFIDSSAKASQESELLATNRLGAYSGYGTTIAWRNRPDSLRWQLSVSLRDRESLYGKFSPDAFRLTFEGNRAFKGQTADLSNTHLTYLHWQQVQLEAKYFSPDGRSTAALGFSILNGQQLQEINLKKTTLFTASDGTYLQAAMEASYYASDTAKTKMFSRNGSGTAFNFSFSTILGDSGSKFLHEFNFSVQDLGYIRWNAHSLIYNVDTSASFSGVDASHAILDPATVTGLPKSDSIIGKPVYGQVISFLPLGLNLSYTLHTPWAWWGGVSFRGWSYADALPHVTLFGGWTSANKKLSAMTGAAWGGYARLQIPVQVGWTACKNFAMMVGTTNLAGYIVPAKTRGQGLYVNLTFAF